MPKNKRKLVYTQLFQQDLLRVAQYIADVLENQTAAEQLLNDTEMQFLAEWITH